MKKSLVALAALAAVAAHAQSSVQFYGVVDATVGTVQHSLSVDPQFPGSVNPFSSVKTSVPSSVTGMFNGGESPSRWGIRGSEDLGSGMKAVFNLESGFNLPTGQISNAGAALASNAPTATTVAANSSIDGQLFNRQAWVGLSDSKLGQIAFGRNYAPIFDVTVANDPLNGSQLFSPLGFSGTIGGGGGVSEDTRVDNSIKYTNKTGDFNYGGMYKLGGVAGSGSIASGSAVNAGYTYGPVSVQAAYQEFRDAVKGGSGSVANQVKLSVYNTKATMVGATYALEQAKIKVGYEEYTLSTPSDLAYAASITSYYGISVQSSAAGLSDTQAKRTTDVLWIGGDYNVTPMFNVAAGYYDQKQKASSDNGQLAGDIYTASLLASYKFSKMTDVYVGYAYSQYKGAAYATGVYTSNNIVGTGLRVRF